MKNVVKAIERAELDEDEMTQLITFLNQRFLPAGAE